ncbi:MmcQ/YjbR family DNA-binding protein [Sediminibacterium soli]|uniref:MmcQ/YjbR family DNA-binding protein n=1 Tax=Sediminibacterium soli TaxID=2698829 RepID=UPI00137ACECD|nr:MmcQ/YjbR family DNA-binding protein [Sediminibacterium soli]NCI45520.1 MmcQ/YjbR family DNA-binding protein [Sediminibacterium soli]
MVSIDRFRKMALAFPDTDEHPHFQRQAFRVRQRIFATISSADHIAMLLLSPAEQSVYCDFAPGIFYPVPGTWGKKGSTFVNLKKVPAAVAAEALAAAYAHTAAKYPPKKKRP